MISVRIGDLKLGDLIALMYESGDGPILMCGVVRGLARCDGITLRLGFRAYTHGPGRAIERWLDVTLSAETEIELVARERVIAQADYRFATSGKRAELWPVALQIVERNGVTYLRTLGALEVCDEIQFSTVLELAALLPEHEDASEIGYLMARNSLLEQYEAMH